ncbi:hypothetical protein PF002_g13857 [Phytophthora fragariae]|uniref:RxLR effector protein n=1 Tax=Phytophthora fragariae TaxID=53985 RepID=A0A6A3FV72_9STRA|nr:hypothetical protein PF009_g2074 [Phytophthora fragariae]KAE9227356.1 hypothetical protein PF002_g13857 [Phytophthora fragariae]
MASSAQPSPFSTKQLLLTALVAFAAGSAQAVEAANATSTNNPNFGKVTSAKGQCVIGNPTTYVTREDVDWVWKNTMSKYVPQFNNLIFDQIVTNKDHLSYCVRWDNEQKLTKAVASKFQAMIQNQMNLWNQWLRATIAGRTRRSTSPSWVSPCGARFFPHSFRGYFPFRVKMIAFHFLLATFDFKGVIAFSKV